MNIASPERNMKRGYIPLKHFHGVSNSSGTSINEHLGLRGHLRKELLSNRNLVSSTRSSYTVVQLANVPEQAKKVVEFDFKKYMLCKALAVNEALREN
jgi:hypothetical protein